MSKTVDELHGEIMKRVDANDATSICLLADCCYKGLNGIQQDHAKAMEIYNRAAELGWGVAHSHLGKLYHEGGYLKKAKFHYEIAAMAGDEVARYSIGVMEAQSGNILRAAKHWTIAASAGDYNAMRHLIALFERGKVSRESIDSTLIAYNNSCAERRSEARDAFMRRFH
jgi:TPR repeat protein